MMPANGEKMHDRKAPRRNQYASREAWHAACEAFFGHLCHYCEEHSPGAPLCERCQATLRRLKAARKTLGLCGCQPVEEWLLGLPRGSQQFSEAFEVQGLLNEISSDPEPIGKIPISVLVKIVASVDDREALSMQQTPSLNDRHVIS